MGIMDAQIPSQRWALPSDSDRDKYENEFELWVNNNYDDKAMKIAGRHMTWDECFEDEWLFDDFIQEIRERYADYDD
jgi:hypothetical protein